LRNCLDFMERPATLAGVDIVARLAVPAVRYDTNEPDRPGERRHEAIAGLAVRAWSRAEQGRLLGHRAFITNTRMECSPVRGLHPIPINTG
jgi:hypothetical protein